MNIGDFGDDIPAFFKAHRVAKVEIQAAYFGLVVQGGSFDHRAGHFNRIKAGHRGYGPCSTHLKKDIQQTGPNALGRVLVSDGPAR